jgi:hypothetical protein
MLYVKAPETDMAELEKVIGELPRVANSLGPTEGKTSRLRWWLVIVNLGIVLVITGFVVRRIVQRKSLP